MEAKTSSPEVEQTIGAETGREDVAGFSREVKGCILATVTGIDESEFAVDWSVRFCASWRDSTSKPGRKIFRAATKKASNPPDLEFRSLLGERKEMSRQDFERDGERATVFEWTLRVSNELNLASYPVDCHVLILRFTKSFRLHALWDSPAAEAELRDLAAYDEFYQALPRTSIAISGGAGPMGTWKQLGSPGWGAIVDIHDRSKIIEAERFAQFERMEDQYLEGLEPRFIVPDPNRQVHSGDECQIRASVRRIFDAFVLVQAGAVFILGLCGVCVLLIPRSSAVFMLSASLTFMGAAVSYVFGMRNYGPVQTTLTALVQYTLLPLVFQLSVVVGVIFVVSRNKKAAKKLKRDLITAFLFLWPGIHLLFGVYLCYRHRASRRNAEKLWVVNWKSDETRAVALINYARLLQSQGKHADAERPFKEAISYIKRNYRKPHKILAGAHHDLALSLAAQGITSREKMPGESETAKRDCWKEAIQQLELSSEAMKSNGRVTKDMGRIHASTLSNQARVYEMQANYNSAEKYFSKALDISLSLRGELGGDHPIIAFRRANVARLLHVLAKYEDAVHEYERAIKTLSAWLGSGNAESVRLRHNVADILLEQAKYSEATKICESALEIRQRALGESHPAVAESLDILAWLLHSQGKFEEARPLYDHSLKIRQEAFGDSHPAVATSFNNLASLLHFLGKYDEARQLYDLSLKIRLKVLGDSHPVVASSLYNLATLLLYQDKLEEAEPLYRRAIEIGKVTLGENHTKLATWRDSFAYLLSSQGKFNEAGPIYAFSLKIRRRAFGDSHPAVADSLDNLARLSMDLGKLDEAKPLYDRSLEIRQKLLGDCHPLVAGSLHELGVLLYRKGKFGEAEPLFRSAIKISKVKFGENHPELATSLSWLAHALREQGKYDEALPLAQQATSILERSFGSRHPRTQENAALVQKLHLAMVRFQGAASIVSSQGEAQEPGGHPEQKQGDLEAGVGNSAEVEDPDLTT